jgi:ribose 5-phosphate isomerase B
MWDSGETKLKKIAMGSDHVGFHLKEAIRLDLENAGHKVIDHGVHSTERADYPEIAEIVGKAVAQGRAERGILICGTGVGVCIAANKVSGVRAVVCSEPYSASMSRAHNDTNVLTLGSRVIGGELAQMIVDDWLATDFQGGRHTNRVQMIQKLEEVPIPSSID